MEIIYYADNGSMGDTSATDCDKFREWAQTELEAKFPNHDITVTDEQTLQTAYTDDIDNEEDIKEFCSSLWDNCPWDNWDNAHEINDWVNVIIRYQREGEPKSHPHIVPFSNIPHDLKLAEQQIVQSFKQEWEGKGEITIREIHAGPYKEDEVFGKKLNEKMQGQVTTFDNQPYVFRDSSKNKEESGPTPGM